MRSQNSGQLVVMGSYISYDNPHILKLSHFLNGGKIGKGANKPTYLPTERYHPNDLMDPYDIIKMISMMSWFN